jgi:hypothetical protein
MNAFESGDAFWGRPVRPRAVQAGRDYRCLYATFAHLEDYMSCNLVRIQTRRFPTLDGGFTETVAHCREKERSETHLYVVYQRLLDLRLEGSAVTTLCPVAATGEWVRCPFRK